MTSKKINKKEIISRLLEVPKKGVRAFWPREMHLLNRLEDRYSLEFLKELTFPQKYDSLAILFNDDFMKKIDVRFKNFQYKPKSYEDLSCNVSKNKFDEDKQYEKQIKTIKDFLNE